MVARDSGPSAFECTTMTTGRLNEPRRSLSR
jgi:hypothetical protein